MTVRLNLMVAATADAHGIGINGGLPWRLRGDMQFFRQVTSYFRELDQNSSKNTVIMGRKTWDSIPIKFRPLPDRNNIVLSRKASESKEDVKYVTSLEQAVESSTGSVWIIGGGDVYKLALSSPMCHRIFLTQVFTNVECDTFFPPLPKEFRRLSEEECVKLLESSGITWPQGIQQEGDIKYEFQIWSR